MLCIVVCYCNSLNLVVMLMYVQMDFYIPQSQAANHAVREATCICTAELGTKVSGWSCDNACVIYIP